MVIGQPCITCINFYCQEYLRTMDIQLRHVMYGMRSRIACCQQERGGRVASGRDPMPFELYQRLCGLEMKRWGRDGNFLYKYMVMIRKDNHRRHCPR
jgi:hypothetical protein